MPAVTPVRFNPQTASREDWARYHEYRRLQHAESHPEEPFWPEEPEEVELKHDALHSITEILWALVGDRVAAVARLWAPRPGSPDYQSQRGILWFDLHVLEEYRRQGIGRSFLRPLAELARSHDGRVIGTSADKPAGLAAAESLGFRKASEARYSRLDLDALDWEQLEGWVAEGARRSPSRSLNLHLDAPPREEWAAYGEAITELFNTIPFEDEDHGDFVFTPETLADQVALFAKTNATMTRILVREADGRITALTEMLVYASQSEHAHQWLTAVHKSVQGNGIGRWIKSAMLLHLRAHHPTVRWVLTDNASSNGPMLRINTELGFRTYRVTSQFQMPMDAFERAAETRS